MKKTNDQVAGSLSQFGVHRMFRMLTMALLGILLLVSPGETQAQCVAPDINQDCDSVTDDLAAYTGGGLTTSPGAGQLCSDSWAIFGMSEGSVDFGGSGTSGDFARGTTNGGVTTGGLYSLNRPGGDHAIWIQPGGSDFDGGAARMVFRSQNNSGATMNGVFVSFEYLYLNNDTRASNIGLSYSTDGVNFTAIPCGGLVTPEAADALGIQSVAVGVSLGDVVLDEGDYLYLQWTHTSSGTGARDEFGWDNITVSAIDATCCAQVSASCGCNPDPGVISPADPVQLCIGEASPGLELTAANTEVCYTNVWIVTKDETANGGDAAVLVYTEENSGASFSYTFGEAGTYCIHSLNYLGTYQDLADIIEANSFDNVGQLLNYLAAEEACFLMTEQCVPVTVGVEVTGQVMDAGCADDNGAIVLTVVGNAPFTFAWSGAVSDPAQQNQMDLAPGDYTVTVTDDNGCTAVETFTVAEGDSDMGAPVIVVCPPAATIHCDGSTDPADTNGDLLEAMDDCTPVGDLQISFTDSFTPGGCNIPGGSGTITRTWIVGDLAGNTATCAQAINVSDLSAPVITCNDVTVQLDGDGVAAVTPADHISATDDCGGTLFFNPPLNVPINFDCNTVGPNGILVIVRDNCNNTAQCNWTVTVEDATAPSLDCPADATVECGDDRSPAELGEPVVTENCPSGFELTYSDSPLTGSCGTITRTFTATDETGNVGTCVQTIVVEDEELPELTCNDITVALDENGQATGSIENYVSVTDNCDGVTLEPAGLSYDCSDVGTPQTISVTATDGCGNTATCEFTVTVVPDAAPSILCAGDGPPSSPSGNSVAVVYSTTELWSPSGNQAVAATLNASVGAGNWDAFDYNTVDPATIFDGRYGYIYLEGGDNTANEFAAFIAANGAAMEAWVNQGGHLFLNSAPNEGGDIDLGFGGFELLFNIGVTANLQGIVQAPGHPIFNGPLTPASGNFTGGYFAHAILVPPGMGATTLIIGENDGDILVEYPYGAGIVMFGGMTTPNFHGPSPNATNWLANLHGYLEQPSLGDNSITLSTDPGLCYYTVVGTELDPTVTYNCELESVTHDYGDAPLNTTLDGAIFSLGTTTVIWTAVDEFGNSSTCAIEITVEDTELPVFASCGDLTIYYSDLPEPTCSVSSGAANGYIVEQFSVTDNCADGEVDVVVSSLVVTSFLCDEQPTDPNLTANVVVTATDDNGNTATCAFELTAIYDYELEVVYCQDITVSLDGDGTATVEPGDVFEAIDEGACNLFVNYTPFSYTFDCSNAGPNTVTFTATTCAGATAECEATVTVQDAEAPVFTDCGDREIFYSDIDPATCNIGSGGANAYIVTLFEATDDCGEADLTVAAISIFDFICDEPIGDAMFNVTVRATDESGNSSDCNFVLTAIYDFEPEVVYCNNISVNLGTDGEITVDRSEIFEAAHIGPCGFGISYDVSTLTFTCEDLGETEVTITATQECTDPEYATAVCVATVTVVGPTAPAVSSTTVSPTCPAEADGYTANGSFTVTVTDNPECAGTYTINATPVAGSGPGGSTPPPTTTVTYIGFPQGAFLFANAGAGQYTLTVTQTGDCDFCDGNVQVFTVTVADGEDTEAPVVSCPAAVTIECSEEFDLEEEFESLAASITVSDNCEIVDTTIGDISFVPVGCGEGTGTYTALVTVTDIGGNTDACELTLEVSDNTAPTLVCTDVTLSLDADGQASLILGDYVEASDMCSEPLSYEPAIDTEYTYECTDIGETSIAVEVTDACGNIASCEINVTIVDDMPPSYSCPADITIECGVDPDPAVTGEPTDIVDNCPGSLEISYEDTFDNICCAAGEIVRTWTVVDAGGTISTCAQAISVVDTVAPVFACVAAITVEIDETGVAFVSSEEVIDGDFPTDECCTEDVFVFLSQDAFTCSYIGENELTVLAVDACGNESSCIVNVTVVDSSVPTIECAPDVTVDCTYESLTANGFTGAFEVGNWTEEIIGNGSVNTDNAPESIVLVGSDDQGGVGPFETNFCITVPVDGSIIFNWTYNTNDVDGPLFDPFGYSIDGSFTELTDPSGLVIQGGVEVLTVVAGQEFCFSQRSTDGILGSSTTLAFSFIFSDTGIPTAVANCPVEFSFEDEFTPTCGNAGVITRTWTVVSAGGNSATCEQTITVIDETAPTIVCPTALTLSLDADGELSLDLADYVTVSDDCSDVTLDPINVTYGCDDIGQETVFVTATDDCGNSAACSFVVVVTDNLAPVIECVGTTPPISPSGNTIAVVYSTTELWSPSGNQSIEQTLNAAFGAGNWDAFDYNTVDASTLFDGRYAYIYLEGGDDLAEEFAAFIADNGTTMEAWVNDGGHLFLNAAPNEGGDIDLGFGGVTLLYNIGVTGNNQGLVQVPGHPIFNGPLTPANGNFTGGYFAHAILVPPGMGATTLIIGENDGDILVEYPYGSGIVMFGGMTTPNFHSPSPNVYNWLSNLHTYMEQPLPSTITVSTDPGVCDHTATGGEFDPTVSDNCGVEYVSHDYVPAPDTTTLDGAVFPIGTTVVVWTAVDVNGNSSTCVVEITVEDTEAPVFAGCEDVTFELSAAETCDPDELVAGVIELLSATDNCSEGVDISLETMEILSTPCDGPEVGLLIVALTYEAVDEYGNVGICELQATVVNDIAPVIESCQPITVELDENGEAIVDVSEVVEASFSHPCDFPITFNPDVLTLGCDDIGADLTIEIEASACGGPVDVCQLVVTVVNNVPTTITCPADVTVNCNASVDPAVNPAVGYPTVSGNCADPVNPQFTYTDNIVAGACVGTGVITRTWTYVDPIYGTLTCTQTITVAPTAPLSAICRNVTVDLDANGEATLTAPQVNNGSTGGCGTLTFSINRTSFSCADIGTQNVILTVTDACGNSATCSAVITVRDAMPPVLTCPGDMVFNLLPGECEIRVNYDIIATDNCTSEEFRFSQTNFTTSIPDALACFGSASNANLRLYDLPGLGVNGPAEIERIGFGVFSLPGLLGNTLNPVRLRTYAYTGPMPGPASIPPAQLSLIAEEFVAIPASGAIYRNVALATPMVIPAGTRLMVEVFANNNGFMIGNTYDPETVPGYFYNDNTGGACNYTGAPNIVTFIAAGFGFLFPIIDIYGLVDLDPVITQVDGTGLTSGDFFPRGTTQQCFIAEDARGNTSSCCFNVTVNEFPNPRTSLVCNDHVNISIAPYPACDATVGADMILEGGPYGCYDDYIVEIRQNGVLLSPPNVVNETHVGQTFEVTVIDPETGNRCWGTLLVEDKIAPVLTCEDAVLDCNQSTDPIAGPIVYENVYVYRSGTPNLAIVSGAPAQVVTVPVGAPAGKLITDVNLAVNVTHTWVADIQVIVRNPAGAQATAFAGQCPAQNGINYIVDDQGAAFNCAQRNDGIRMRSTAGPTAMAALNGTAAAGNWQVSIVDNVGGDDGTWHSYTLEVGYEGTTSPYRPGVEDCLPTQCTYTDNVNRTECAGDYWSVIERTWTCTDSYGNASTCVQTLYINRVELEDICSNLRNYDGMDLPAFNCDGNWARDANGNPAPSVTGAPGSQACNIQCVYNDLNIPLCGEGSSARKILRRWTCLDWCRPTGQVAECNQVIKVMDTLAPALTVVAPTLVERQWNCDYDVRFNRPTVTDNCSEVVRISVSGPGFSGDFYRKVNGVVTIDNVDYPRSAQPGQLLPLRLPVGVHTIVYTAEDACGNIRTVTEQLDLRDRVPPTAICEKYRVASLGPDCRVRIPATSFDDGSYDNCGIVRMEVARMTPSQCYTPASAALIFRDSVDFCCSDIGATEAQRTVVFRAIDAAGNSNTCMVLVEVQDKLLPVVTCPPNITVDCRYHFGLTEVELGEQFGRVVKPGETRRALPTPSPFISVQTGATLLDGTANDNCGNQPAIGCDLTITTVSSADLVCRQGTVTRVFTVTDAAGNTARCTQVITVVNLYPFDASFYRVYAQLRNAQSYPQYPNGPYEDNTPAGQKVFSDQSRANLRPINTTYPSRWDIVWPADLEVDFCGVALDPESLKNNPRFVVGSYPYYGHREDLCSQIGMTYDEWEFDFDAGCKKIIRRWKVIDWCQEETVLNPWMWDQVIKVIDLVGPTITAGPYNFCTSAANCVPSLDEITIVAYATDNCATGAQIRWDWEVYPFGDRTQVIRYTGSPLRGDSIVIARQWPLTPDGGPAHILKLVAEDGCGNKSTREVEFRIRDCKKPTPICYNGLAADLMPATGEVPVPAKLWDAGSYDNCTAQPDLRFRIERIADSNGNPPAASDSVIVFNCDDLGSVEVRLWVVDQWGNWDYCDTYILIQNNMGADCPDQEESIISGQLNTEISELIATVTVNVSTPTNPNYMTVQADGNFAVGLPEMSTYTVKPNRNDNPLNGVSTTDILMIQRHILGTHKLDSPYKLIAADANNSKTISAADLADIRKVLLGKAPMFSNNTSWRFVPEAYVFEDADNAQAEEFPESITINPLIGDVLGANFVGIKVGDVNGNVKANLTSQVAGRSGRVFELNTADADLKAGNEYTIAFRAKDIAEVLGYQFTLNFETDVLDFVGMEAGALNVTEENFGFTMLSEGMITTSWNTVNAIALSANDVLFTLKFRAKESARLSDVVSANSRYTAAEAIALNGTEINLALVFTNLNGTVTTATYELYQNVPNPFANETMIGFSLPEAMNAKITVYDVAGRVVKEIEGSYAKGLNNVIVKKAELPAAGVLYYQLEAGDFKATKKMIILE